MFPRIEKPHIERVCLSGPASLFKEKNARLTKVSTQSPSKVDSALPRMFERTGPNDTEDDQYRFLRYQTVGRLREEQHKTTATACSNEDRSQQ